MKTVILLGAPGSGKGTQSQRFKDELNYFHVSTGDLIRAEISNSTELGNKFKEYSSQGKLVPDSLVLDVLENGLKGKENENWLFDGYPRNIEQAGMLEDLLSGFERKVDHAVFLDCDHEVLFKRLTGRRLCKDCGAIYNVFFLPPKVDGVCDSCNSSNLYQRKDDHGDVIETRLKVYNEETAPLITHYENENVLGRIGSEGDLEKIWSEIKTAVS